MSQILRQGGTAGMLAVLLFVVSLGLGSGQFSQTSVTLFDSDEALGQTFWGLPPMVVKLAQVLNGIVVPLLILATFHAFSRWMADEGWRSAGWGFAAAQIALGLWVLSGAIVVFIVPAVQNNFLTEIDLPPDDIQLLLMSLAAGIYDGAYFVWMLPMAWAGYFLIRTLPEGSVWLGWQGIVVGITTMIALLLGPYDELAFFSIYAYGAPLWGLFSLSIVLLLQADRLDKLAKTSATS